MSVGSNVRARVRMKAFDYGLRLKAGKRVPKRYRQYVAQSVRRSRKRSLELFGTNRKWNAMMV